MLNREHTTQHNTSSNYIFGLYRARPLFYVWQTKQTRCCWRYDLMCTSTCIFTYSLSWLIFARKPIYIQFYWSKRNLKTVRLSQVTYIIFSWLLSQLSACVSILNSPIVTFNIEWNVGFDNNVFPKSVCQWTRVSFDLRKFHRKFEKQKIYGNFDELFHFN